MENNIACDLVCKAIDEVSAGKYLLAPVGIRKILRCFTVNETLNRLLHDVNKNFRYRLQFEKCKIDGNSEKRFLLPTDEKKVIALVTGILLDIDNENIDFHDFINRYFYNMNLEICFDNFCKDILFPYKEAFQNVLIKGVTYKEDEKEEAEREPISFANAHVALAVKPVLERLEESLQECELSERERRQYKILTDGLFIALEIGDIRLVRAVWVGIINTIVNKPARLALDDIRDILVKYNILS